MSSDLPVKIFRGFPGNVVHICHFNILDAVAVGTDKMTVGFGVAVKPVRAVPCGNLGNFPQLHQERQIPVYSSQADVGEFFFDPCVYIIRSRMFVTVPDKVPDRFSLPAVFQCSQGDPLLSIAGISLMINNSNCY